MNKTAPQSYRLRGADLERDLSCLALSRRPTMPRSVRDGSASGARHPCCRLVKDVGASGEVQARVAAARGAEPQAGLERDAAVVEEPFARAWLSGPRAAQLSQARKVASGGCQVSMREALAQQVDRAGRAGGRGWQGAGRARATRP